MQLTLLQEDLFSAGDETPAKPSKKSRAAAPKKPVFNAVSNSLVALALQPEPVEEAPPVLETAAAPAVETVQPEAEEEICPELEAMAAAELAKAPGAFKTISEVAKFLGLEQHVLRFWESRFSQIKPLKMRGGRRYYRPEDIEVLTTIQHLLYKQGYTINGAKKAFSHGKNAVIQEVQAEVAPAPIAAKPAAPKFSDKQKNQLTAIRQELYALRETLKPYIENRV